MKKAVILFLICSPFFVFSQTETGIRNHYADTNKQIAESIAQGFEGPLYHNQWVTNKNGKSWPAVGLYTETTDFWYDDDPTHIGPAERDPTLVLLKVNISRRSSHLQANEEYLYKEGKLLFYYSRETEEGNEWETRIYFNTKGIAFKSTVTANGKELTAKDLLTEDHKDLKPNPVFIRAAAKKYQDLFVKSML